VEQKPFRHTHAAHCESGVMSSLLTHAGFEISEPMAFGVGGGLSFAYIPFLKMGNLPVISYRMFPGMIIKKLTKRLGIEYEIRRYKDEKKAMDELDEFVRSGRIVGLRTSAYFITYFPPEMRFQFNAHNILICGKEDNEYIVSDPVFDSLQRIGADDLQKARFARGLSAPKGYLHYPVSVPSEVDLDTQIFKAIRNTSRMMLYAPTRMIGVKGIKHLGNILMRLPSKKDPKYIRHFVGNIVRMQEEIGSGGAGFRFMYAAFLQEVYARLGLPVFKETSEMMTANGDEWREVALACARVVKSKKDGIEKEDLRKIADMLAECSRREKEIFLKLRDIKSLKSEAVLHSEVSNESQ
jgi:hypothetical protein